MKSDYRVESKHMHLTVMNVFHQLYKIIIASDNTRTVHTHCMVSFPSEARLQVSKIVMLVECFHLSYYIHIITQSLLKVQCMGPYK